ncbi:MAG TPA: hypothetical protein VEG28_03405 [Dehalococcoidia bacterium]|nr:hypothetical protein [Dehalococcoidia bacterium]
MNPTESPNWVAMVAIVILACAAIITLILNHAFNDFLAVVMTILFAICGVLAIRYGRRE